MMTFVSYPSSSSAKIGFPQIQTPFVQGSFPPIKKLPFSTREFKKKDFPVPGYPIIQTTLIGYLTDFSN